ncbi:MAG: LuxR C-terminal-related transcriptional regulator [Brevibacterium sp.]
MFGYASELAVVVESLSGDECCGVLIVGPAGVGKTTVANAALSRLDPSLSVTRLRGSEGARTRNLGIFEILLSQAGIGTDIAPGRSLSVLGELFSRRAAGAEALVVVDNADLVDDHSLAVLAQLADARRIRLLIAAESARPPIDLIVSLWIAGHVVRVDLDGIDEEAATSMITSIGLMESETRSVSELCGLAHGNPRLLERLLYGHRRTSSAESAIARADDRSRKLVETISLTESVPYDILVRLTDAATLDSLAEIGLVSISKGRGAEVSMREPVTAENVRTAIPPSRSLELLSRFDSRIDPSGLRDRSLFGHTSWSLAVGRVPAPEQILAAAAWANAQGRYLAAAEIIRTSGYRGDALDLELARCEWGVGRLREARELIDPLIAKVCADPESAGGEYLSRLASMEVRLTDPRHPECLRLDWARDRLSLPSDLGRLDATRARFELKGGRLSAASALAETVYRNHECSARHRLRACTFLGVAEVMAGRIDVGLGYIEQARLMFELPGPGAFEREDAVPQFFAAYYIAGSWSRAKTALIGLTSSRRLTQLTTALVDLRTGRVADALRDLGELRLMEDTADAVDLSGVARSAQSLAAVLAERASDIVSIAGMEPTDASQHSWWASFEARLFDLQALAHTSPAVAATELYELGAAVEERGAHTLTALAWLEAATLGHPQSISVLPSAAAQVEGSLGRLLRSAAEAFDVDTLETLVTAAREAQAFGATVLCSQLASAARDRAIAEGNPTAAKEARLLYGRSQRVIDFNGDSTRVQDTLSELEIALVDGIIDSRSSAQLGAELHLSKRTVEWHLGRIYRRLHVANRQELREVVTAWRSN